MPLSSSCLLWAFLGTSSLLISTSEAFIPRQPNRRVMPTPRREYTIRAPDVSLFQVEADTTSCSTLLEADETLSPWSAPSARVTNTALDLFLERGEHACALWYLSEALGRDYAYDRRSLVLGMKACCRMGEEVRALEIYKHLHSIDDSAHRSSPNDHRLYKPEEQLKRWGEEEVAAMAEVQALTYNHAQVLETYNALLGQPERQAGRHVYVSLANAFMTLGSESFASSVLDEMNARSF